MNSLQSSSSAEFSPFTSNNVQIAAASPSQVQAEYNPFRPNGHSAPQSVVPEMPWTTPLPTRDYNPFTQTHSPFGETMSPGSTQLEYTVDQRPTVGERVAEKARAAKEMAKRAFAAIGLRKPNMSATLRSAYESDYGQKLSGMAQGAVKETAVAAAMGGVNALTERYGLGYENGRVTVESKRQLAKGAFRMLRMPQVEAMSTLRAVSQGMYTAGRQEAVSQARDVRTTLVDDARGAARGVFTQSPFIAPR